MEVTSVKRRVREKRSNLNNLSNLNFSLSLNPLLFMLPPLNNQDSFYQSCYQLRLRYLKLQKGDQIKLNSVQAKNFYLFKDNETLECRDIFTDIRMLCFKKEVFRVFVDLLEQGTA
jgi:hypothetical protein